jgi:uncharacterized membrane protein YccF (DUF307 family)
MNTTGNILWFFLGGGIVLFFLYVFGGIILCLTIIGIPFGIQVFKIGLLAVAPFGQTVEYTARANGCLNTLMNVIWILAGGFWITIAHFVLALLMAITIIGIPFAKQHIKLAAFALNPFGKISFSS